MFIFFYMIHGPVGISETSAVLSYGREGKKEDNWRAVPRLCPVAAGGRNLKKLITLFDKLF